MRKADSRGEDASRLHKIVMQDQWLNIVFLVPAILFFNVAAAIAIHARPDFFLLRRGHLRLIALQGLGFVSYLLYVIRAYTKLTPLIAAAREECRAAEAVHSS